MYICPKWTTGAELRREFLLLHVMKDNLKDLHKTPQILHFYILESRDKFSTEHRCQIISRNESTSCDVWTCHGINTKHGGTNLGNQMVAHWVLLWSWKQGSLRWTLGLLRRAGQQTTARLRY